MGLKGNNGFWKWLAAVAVLFLLLNPETIQLAVFIDAIGIEMLFWLLEVQILALGIAAYSQYLAPLLHWFKRCLFPVFTPNYPSLREYPGSLALILPGAASLMHGLVLSAAVAVAWHAI